MNNNRTLATDLAKIAVVVALMIVFTLFVSIPLGPIPLTFQTAICVCSGLILGSKKGAISMFVYFFIGFICHIPVFSGFTGGFVSALKPSFGYIIGFIPAAFFSGFIVEKAHESNWIVYMLAAIAGVIINYIVGLPYFMIIWKFYLARDGLSTAVLSYNLVYLIKDIPLALLASRVCKAIHDLLNKK